MPFRARILPSILLVLAGCTSPENPPRGAADAANISVTGPDATAPTDAGSPADTGPEPPTCGTERVREYISIPMRDGQMLHASIDRPVNPSCRIPTILVQTPYNIENHHMTFLGDRRGEMPLFSSPHYNFVTVDWRGLFGSRAAAVTPPQPYARDGFDTVEWIAAQPWSDGNVGTWGVSALCVQQYRTAAMRPPSLKAAVPIFCSMNVDYPAIYPGGVIRREYVDTLDGLGFSVKAAFEAHPTFDEFWSLLGGAIRPDSIEVPMLIVSGWWDLDPLGALRSFQLLRGSQHRLLIGNWHHFAAGSGTGAFRKLSEQELAYFDSARQIQVDSLAFFDHHLRGVDSEAADWANVRYDQVGEGMKSSDSWPPSATEVAFHLLADGTLSRDRGAPDPMLSMDVTYDPADPSPTRGGGTLLPTQIHGPTSQADVIERDDQHTFVTAPLTDPLAIAGAIRVALEVSTAGQDTDFAVRLTDVDEQGDHLLIGEGIQRLKFRNGFSDAEEVRPGQRYALEVRLTHDLGYTIAAGHRLGLIVSSANFPRFDRNPNDGEDFFESSAAPQTVVNSIYPSGSTLFVSVAD